MNLTRSSRAGLALASTVLMLGATSAVAEDGFVPVPVTGQMFLQCTDDAIKVDTATATWGPEAPASVTTGAGCGKPDDPIFTGTVQESPYTMALKGTVKGNLDSLTVTLHSADFGPGRAPGAPVTLDVRATVGGKSLFGFTENESVSGVVTAAPLERQVTVTPTATGATGGVRAYTFTITGIDFLTQEDLDKRGGHSILIDVADATPVTIPTGSLGASNANAWMWGAAEAPSSVVFSPEAPAEAVLVADERSTRK